MIEHLDDVKIWYNNSGRVKRDLWRRLYTMDINHATKSEPTMAFTVTALTDTEKKNYVKGR